jgi:putative hydrolase of the HAD superfamily
VSVAAVVFDVDGTLIDYDRARREGFARYAVALGLPADGNAWDRWLAAEDVHFRRYLDGELSFEDQRRERVRAFLAEPLDAAAADDWFAGYLTHFEASWRLFDDVPATLDALAGLSLAAFSNVSGAYTRRKIEAVGLARVLVGAWGVDDVGAAKPAEATFLGLCERLGVPPASVVHVGDRYGADALGAVQAGLTGVWLDRPGAEPDGRVPHGAPDPRVQVVSSLAELPALVRSRDLSG